MGMRSWSITGVACGITAAVLLVGGLSCKESLPPYADPRDVFDGWLAGAYGISRTENAMKAYLTIINKFDETLEDTSILTGEIELTWQADPSFRRRIQLNESNILFVRYYDPTTRILRFDPGDSIRFGISWDFLSDDGRDLKRLVTFVQDPTCLARWISREPVGIMIEGTLNVFKRTETVIAPRIMFQFTLVREYVDPRGC